MEFIIDVDTGIDDAIALIYLAHKNNIAGITTVCGNVPLTSVVRNTCFTLELISSSTPVYIGDPAPLCRQPVHDFDAHGEFSLGLFTVPETTVTNLQQNESANDFLERTINASPTYIISLAPLTNIARLLSQGKVNKNNIVGITIMGGVINESGNITPSAEFNFYADPEAAFQVINSGINITVIPLDVTRQVVMRENQINLLSDKVRDIILNIMTPYLDMYKSRYGLSGAAVHDLTAVMSVFHPELFDFKYVSMDIETCSQLNDGRSVVDFQYVWKKQNNVRLCTGLNAKKIIECFIDEINI